MELRELAAQVLFGTSLAEKLVRPSTVTDKHPGCAIHSPAMPGRPNELIFKPAQALKADFPNLAELEDERERGRLLHFFANHELLAAELMALVLLKFPDAPASFRQGVLRTLRDEQEHTRWYIERMKQCGIQFGELPVSGYFWRAISGMQEPMDYVSGLSLTFEQANLDFAKHYAGEFKTLGDASTAELLNRIYHDEIAHVAYGLKWFRRWKDPGETDWHAFRRTLKFPLSPNRAKGASFNIEGRKAAGFESSFIQELSVFSQSKGRTPVVYLFNPFVEGFLASGKGFTPVKQQTQLTRDLQNLPQFLGRQDDVVLLEQRPSVAFLSELKKVGFALPEFIELNESQRTLRDRKISGLRPWGWGPDSIDLLQPLMSNLTGKRHRPDDFFNPDIAKLYSKSWSAELLKEFLSEQPAEPWLCEQTEVGTAVKSLDAACEAIEAIRTRGHHRIVIKEALGLAGHNAIRLWEPEILEAQKRWLAQQLELGRTLVIEPWLERKMDFSIQLEMGERLKLAGHTGLMNDQKGQFLANWAAPNYERRLPAQVTEFFADKLVGHKIHELYEKLLSLLESKLKRTGFQGPIGIDAFVYLTARGERKLKPIVEINPRYTMGRLLVELMRRACPGRFGMFRLINRSMCRRAGFDSFHGYASALVHSAPVQLEGNPVPRISEGIVELNESGLAEACLALFKVSRDRSELFEWNPPLLAMPNAQPV